MIRSGGLGGLGEETGWRLTMECNSLYVLRTMSIRESHAKRNVRTYLRLEF